MKTEPLPSLKSSMKPITKVRVDLSPLTAPVHLKIVNENWLAADSKIIT
jgi:hypothetical protein